VERRLVAGGPLEECLDFLGVWCPLGRAKVGRQIDARRPIGPERERVAATIAAVVRRTEDVDEPIADDQRARVIPSALEDLLKVREHSHGHGARVDRAKVRSEGVRRRDALAARAAGVEALRELEEIVTRERLTPMERVGVVALRTADPHEKVPRKADPVDSEADPTPHRDHQHREGDGDADASREDLVQVAVSRVIVARLVAAKAELLEESRIQGLAERPHVRETHRLLAERSRDRIELTQARLDVKPRVCVRRDRQRDVLDAWLVDGEGTRESAWAHDVTLHGSPACCNLRPMQVGGPVHPKLPWIRTLDALADARGASLPGDRVRALARAGRALGDELRGGPRVLGVKTLNVTTLPYPTRFAFNGAVPLPWPFVILTHRTLLVRLATAEGTKHVLFNPTDANASRRTPFFEKLAASLESRFSFAERLLAKPFPSLEAQLAAAGVRPEDIDVVAYDHFHTQDVRPILGQGDGGRFPNAVLLAPKQEWCAWDSLHPMQRAWMIADGKRGVPDDRVVTFDADLALGEGCLLLRTPGHTVGNQTLFVHGAEGVFGCSENGCSADNWAPRSSRIPGLAGYAEQYEVEVVLNANTPEFGGTQYESMVLERSVVDAVPGRPDLVQMFPSSEVTASAVAPLVKPSIVFGHRDSGAFARA